VVLGQHALRAEGRRHRDLQLVGHARQLVRGVRLQRAAAREDGDARGHAQDLAREPLEDVLVDDARGLQRRARPPQRLADVRALHVVGDGDEDRPKRRDARAYPSAAYAAPASLAATMGVTMPDVT
jgi:hypothetical protein